MNKLKLMQKKLVTIGGIALAAIAVAAGVMIFTGSMATSAAERKQSAESSMSADRGQLDSMKSQLSQSSDAEKRYIEVMEHRKNDNFVADSDAMKDWLRHAKDQYRFGDTDFKLTMPLEKPSTRQGLPTVGFDIVERPEMKLELTAISDLHVFSFLDALVKETSGIIRINAFDLERTADIDSASLRALLTGQNPTPVKASVEFTWVGIHPKPEGTADNAAGGAPVPQDPAAGGAP